MKKRIAFIIVSFVVCACSAVLLGTMMFYVATYSPYNSFMLLGDAIAWVIALSLLSNSAMTVFIIFLIQVIEMQIKKSKAKKKSTK